MNTTPMYLEEENARNHLYEEHVEKNMEGFEDEDGLNEDNKLNSGYGLDYNIQKVSKVVDLSPRYTNSINSKRERSNVPLQVKTRTSKGRLIISDQ